MLNTYTLALDSSPLTLSGSSPAKVSFDPSAFNTSKRIYSIVYSFGDKTPDKVVTYTKYTRDLNLLDIDPYFTIVDHTYDSPGTYTGTVSIYQLGLSVPTVINFTITLERAAIYDLQILKTSMYGSNNEVFFVFESDTPRLIFPAIASWQRNILNEPINLYVPVTPSPTPTVTITPSITLTCTPTPTITTSHTPTPTITPTVTVTPSSPAIIALGSTIRSSGRGRFVYRVSVSAPDYITLSYNSKSLPDKFSIISSTGVLLATSGWVGDSAYNLDLNANGQPNVSGPGVGSIYASIQDGSTYVYAVVESVFNDSVSTIVVTAQGGLYLSTEEDIFILTEDDEYIIA